MDKDWERPPPAAVPSGIPVPVDTISGTGSGLITVRRSAVRVDSTVDSLAGNSHAAEQGYRKLE